MSAHKRCGRRKPYTAIGIRRLPCFRCGQKAAHQWSICADGNLQRPICLECDIDLNRLVLDWSKDPNAKQKIKEYRKRAESA